MRVIAVMAALVLSATTARAQLAVVQPTEKVAVLPLMAAPADSAASVQAMDVARSRLETLAKYKALIVPKKKLCEVLTPSGYLCDELLDADESASLARTLQLDAYTQGRLERRGGRLYAQVRVVDIGHSGFARSFAIEDSNPGTPAALGELIAQRLNLLIKAGEHARECDSNREKSQFPRAIQSAQKALQADPDLTSAHLCLLNTYEAMKMRPDSIIAVAERALRGDPMNSTALERLASAHMQKSDTTQALAVRYRQWKANPKNKPLLLGMIQMEHQRKHIDAAVGLVDSGLVEYPNDAQLGDIRTSLCIEGELPCSVDALVNQARRDSTKLRDTAFVKVAIGAAQKYNRPEVCRQFSAAATAAAPASASFWKARGTCFEASAMIDSALWAYRKASDLDPRDIAGALLVAKTMVDGAGLDSASIRQCAGDTACVTRVRGRLADRMDTAKVYITRGLQSPDSTLRFTATVLAMTAGQKLAQAQAYGRAYPWLDSVMTTVAQRSAADTVGPRAQVRYNTNFWWGLASTITLAQPFQTAVATKKCDEIKPVIDRMARTKEALRTGRRIHPPTADQMLGILAKYEANIPKIRDGYHCKNF